MKNALVRLGFCLLFICTASTLLAVDFTTTITRVGAATQHSPAFLEYNVVFGTAVTDFIDADIQLSGAGAAGATAVVHSGSGTSYVVRVTGMTVTGAVTVFIAANAATAGADKNLASNNETITYDGNPNVVVSHAPGDDPSVNTSTVVFVVTFDEDVVGFAGSSVTLSGGTGMGGLSVQSVSATTPNRIFNVTVLVPAAGRAAQPVTLAVNANAVDDAHGNGNNASTGDGTITYGGVAPSVTLTGVTGIDDDRFTVEGNVTNDGGFNNVQRGSVWKENSAPSAGDNLLQSGTGGGTFTHLRNEAAVDPEKHYFVKTYATNGVGGTILSSSTLDFWTLSAEPTTASNVTLTAQSTTSFRVQFDDFNGGTNTEGIAIFRKAGSAITAADIKNGKAPVVAGADMPLIIYVTTNDATEELPAFDTGLTPGTVYYYAAVPFNWDESHPETYHYLSTFTQTSGATVSFDSRLTLTNSPATIPYINETGTGAITGPGDGIIIAELTLIDGVDATTDDGDALPTNIQTLKIHVDNHEMINRIAILDGTTDIHDEGILDASGNITFTVSSGDLQAVDNNDAAGSPDVFWIIASFNTANVDDGAIIRLTVEEITLFPGSSQLIAADGGGADTGPTNNAIAVVATKLEFSGVSSTINPGTNFGLTVTALDANNKVDKNVGGTVELTMTAGDGNFTSTDTPGGLTRSLVLGTTTWSQLKIDEALDKTLTANHSGSIPDKTLDITVTSLGFSLSNATTNFCFNSADASDVNTFRLIANIVIEEQSKSDFKAGNDQTLTLMLPPGFIFHTGTTPTVDVTGSDISKSAGDGFNGFIGSTSNIMRIRYDISGTNGVNKDRITIGNVKVKYTGATALASSPAKVVRIGGSAVISGSLEGDDTKPFASFTVGGGSLDVSFKNVVTPNVSEEQTTFSKIGEAAVLKGTKALDANFILPGVFTGEGVSFEGGEYKFFPSTVDEGAHDILFTYVNPNPDATFGNQVGCISTGMKTYTMFSTIITGLNPDYCINGTPSALGAPTTATPGGECVPLVGPNRYNAGAYKYQYYNYTGSGWTDLPNQASFNPADPAFASTIAYVASFGYNPSWLLVAVAYQDQCDLSWDIWYSTQIYINPRPPISFTTNPLDPNISHGICAFDADRDLIGSPYNPETGYDEFWVSEVGAPGTVIPAGTVGSRLIGFKFSPSGANPTGVDKNIQINYRHQDPFTECTNQMSQVVSVWRKPPAVPASKIFSRNINDVSAEFCRDETITQFEINAPDPSSAYRWYDNAGTTVVSSGINGVSTTFTPGPTTLPYTAGFPDAGTTGFKVSQTEHRVEFVYPGCESDKTNISIQIFAPPVVTFTPAQPTDMVICEGGEFLLSKAVPVITPGGLGGTWSSLHPSDPGEFRLPNGFVDNDFGDAVTYKPSPTEYLEGTATIQLATLDPTGPCGIVTQEIKIRINPGVTVFFPVSPVRACAADEISLQGLVSNNLAFTWSVDTGSGTIDPATVDKNFVIYRPHTTEKNQGGLVKLELVSDDPDGAGPCDPASGIVQLNIDQPPRIDAGPDKDFCAGETISLTGSKPLGLSSAASWSWTTDGGAGDAGIVDQNALLTSYNPSPAEDPGPQDISGSSRIVFTLTSDAPGGGNVCPGVSDEAIITVHFKPTVPVLLDPRKYCVDDNVELLRAEPKELAIIQWYDEDPAINPTAGVATGASLSTGVTANAEKKVSFWATQIFDRVQSGFDGCESDASSVTITVNPKPLPLFSFQNKCFGDVMEFTDLSTVAPRTVGDPDGPRTLKSWKWNFDDNLGDSPIGDVDVTVPAGTHDDRTTGTFNNPRHEFKNTGEYNVLMTVYTSDGCFDTFLQPDPIPVGPIPIPEFSVAKLCEDDDTKYTYTGTEFSSITGWAWNFGDPGSGGDNNSTQPSPSHTFSDFGTYTVELTVSTSLGCDSTITRQTSISPYVKNFPYIEDFETNHHGWVPEGKVFDGSTVTTESSWNLLSSAGSITPDPLPNVGPTFWATHTTGIPDNFYFNNERSVLYGPCVDLTTLTRPVLAMDYFNDTERQGDGVYVEYREEDDNGNGTWTRLGDNVNGLNWYDENSIGGLALLGNVGQNVSQFGWSGTSEAWTTGRFNLDPLVGMSRVRFRVVFGSNFSPVNTDIYDGFAFDYFKLESRNRLVLVENFTSASSSSAVAGNTDAFKSFPSAASAAEVVKIEYHTGLPAAAGDPEDPIFKQNPMDPNARASFYGLSAVPRGYIDGYTNAAGSGMFSGAWAGEYYSKESLKTSPIDIQIDDPTIVDGTLNVKGTVLASEIALPANSYSIYVVVVEEEVGNDAYVLRKMLPSASGRKVPATAKGGTFTFDESWSIERSYVGADQPKLIAIAFVQSDIINELGERPVLQAASNLNTPVPTFTTGIEVPFLEQVAMYPNPADRIVNIQLPQPTATGVEVSVIDQLGRSVIKRAIGIGERSTAIDTGDLAGSVYVIQLKENGVTTARKLVVAHKH